MKKLVIAAMLGAFTAAVALPVVVGSDALAAEKKKTTKMEKVKKKKPTGKM